MEPSSGLAVLPPRPPTPPKNSSAGMTTPKDAEQLDLPRLPSTLSRAPNGSPNDSPSSSAEYSNKSIIRTSKKVGFAMGPGGVTPVTTSSPEFAGANTACTSSYQQKPTKSILKPSYNIASDTPDQHSPAEKQDFPRMLEDLVRELAGLSTSSRLDAYLSLNGCLKTYKNETALRALRDKMPLLSDFIQRDLTESKPGYGVRTTQISTEVVRLVTTLLWSPTMEEILPTSLQVFIVGQSIDAIVDVSTPKVLVNQYLHLLAFQNFRSTVMTNERVNRLISSLEVVSERITGKQVISHRLNIYKRLIGQARGLMLARVNDWIEHLLHALMSDTKEIRVRAISLGIDAGTAFGAAEPVSRAVKDVFRQQILFEDAKMQYGNLFIDRLNKWTSMKDEARLVPQIWSVIVLLLRHQPKQFENWPFTVPWLKSLQRCFNSSDVELKIQANRAWSRFIFVVNPQIRTSSSMVALLRDPIKAQLDRLKMADKDTKKTRAAVYSAYSTLLYYAFRPGMTEQSIVCHWKAFIESVISNPAGISSIDKNMVCKVLLSLLGAVPHRGWNLNRVLEPMHIRLEEIPRLDPKWVRSNIRLVLVVLETLLRLESWWWLEDGEKPPILQVWHSLTKAISDAGAKEIKVSMEAMGATAEIMGTINRFHKHCCRSTATGSNSTALQRTSSLIKIAAINIGPLPFCEKRLLQSSPISYQAAETPSSRTSKHRGTLSSAIGHLLDLLLSTNEDDFVDESYTECVEVILNIALRSASSRGSRLKVLRDASQYTVSASYCPDSHAALWNVITKLLMVNIVPIRPEDTSSDDSQQIGHDFREALKILETGTRIANFETALSWSKAVLSVDSQVKKETGAAGSTLSIIEPLAACLTRISAGSPVPDVISASSLLERGATLVKLASWPTSRNEFERARKALWGTSIASSGAMPALNNLDPLFTMINELLGTTYKTTKSEATLAAITTFINALGSFISLSPLPTYALVLQKIQAGLACWIEDTDGFLISQSSTAAIKAVYTLWESIVEKIGMLEELNLNTLTALEPILSAGIVSKHKAIANTSIILWNRTFGLADNLDYSQHIRKLLARLSHVTEIYCEGRLLDDQDAGIDSSPLRYHETQGDMESIQSEEIVEVPLATKIFSPFMKKDERRGRSQNTAPGQRATTPRLRHDDSQIQFAAVESSPTAMDSQLLTDHQKEVKERQQHSETAAMFSDLRSTSRPRSSQDRPTPRLQLNRLQLKSEVPLEHSDIDEAHSPTLPQNDNMFLGSSPTPSQRQSLSDDKPSGPTRLSLTPKFHAPVDQDTLSDPPSSPPLMASSAVAIIDSVEQGNALIYSTSGGHNNAPNERLMSEGDGDVFLDAVSEHDVPALDISDSASQQCPFDPVEAQILSDMQYVCSQSQDTTTSSQLSVPDEAGNISPTRKRKGHPRGQVERAPKRSRGRRRKSFEPVVVKVEEVTEAASEEEEILDCIVLSRPQDKEQTGRRSILRVESLSQPESTTIGATSLKRRLEIDVTDETSAGQEAPKCKNLRHHLGKTEEPVGTDSTGVTSADKSGSQMRQTRRTALVVSDSAQAVAPPQHEAGIDGTSLYAEVPVTEVLVEANEETQAIGMEDRHRVEEETFLARVHGLLADAQTLEVATKGGEISLALTETLMKVQKLVMEGKKRGGQ